MPRVKFTYALKRFFPELGEIVIKGDALPEILDSVESKYPGIKNYILDEQGALRKHVNIFIDGELIRDRNTLSDSIDKNSEIYIMQALSGG